MRNIKKLKRKRIFCNILAVVVFFAMTYAFFYLVKTVTKEIESVGLKNIIEDIWYGEGEEE